MPHHTIQRTMDANASQLMDEILSAIPDARRVDEDGVATEDSLRVESTDTDVRVDIADDLDIDAVITIVEDHEPVPYVDPRIAIIDAMDISEEDKISLKLLFNLT